MAKKTPKEVRSINRLQALALLYLIYVIVDSRNQLDKLAKTQQILSDTLDNQQQAFDLLIATRDVFGKRA